MANTDGPFEYYSEIHSGIDGNSIRSAAQHPGTNAGVIQALAGELEGDEKKTAGAIEGAIEDGTTANPKAAKGTAQDLAAKGTYAVGLLNLFASYVDTFDKTVDSLNSQYNTEVQNSIFGLMHIPEYKTGQEKIDRVAIGKGIEADLRPKYNAALTKLDTDADTIATKFSQGPKPENVRELIRAGLLPLTAATLYPGLVLTNDDQAAYYRSVMADMTATQRAQYLLKHDEIPIAVVNLVLAKDRGTANELGKYVADKVRGLDIDSDGDDVQDAVDLLNRFKGSGEASAAIIANMGGKDLVKVIAECGGRAYQGDEDGLTLAKSLRDVFRSGEPVLASHDPEASRTLARDMVHELTDYDDHKMDANDSVALSYLLKDSTLSTPFLDTMGDELEHMERSNANENFTWRGFGMMQHGETLLFDPDDREAAFDPMASYMSALGHNDEASLQFFTSGGENPYHVSGDDRQDYWIEHRYWSHDNFDGLMSALDAATTGAHTINDHDAHALVTSMIDHLVDRGDVDWNGVDGEKFDPGDVSSDGTKHIAHILGTYMGAVDYYLEHPSSDDAHIGDTANITNNGLGLLKDMPVFRMDDLAQFVKVGVSTEDGFDAMRSVVSNYQNLAATTEIRDHYGKPDWDLTWKQTSDNDARLEGFFLKNVGDVEIADGKDKDDQVKAWIDLGKDLAGEIPFDKVPIAGQAVGFLADHGLDAVSDHMKEVWANNEAKATDSATTAAESALTNRENGILRQLYDTDVTGADGKAHTAVDTGDLHAAGKSLGLTNQQVDDYFKDGFPSNDEINNDQNLQNLLYEVADGGKLDMNEYKHSYSEQYQPYFDKP